MPGNHGTACGSCRSWRTLAWLAGMRPLVYTPAGTTRSLIAPLYLSGTLSMFTAGGPDNVSETFIASGAPHAQADRLRRRYVRQAQAIGARQDGDVPGIGGRSVCRPAQEAWHSDRPEGRPAQERSARGRNRRKRAQDFSKNQVVTAPFGACNEISDGTELRTPGQASLGGDRIFAESGTVTGRLQTAQLQLGAGPDQFRPGVKKMHRRQYRATRNKLDLTDRVQVRIVRKRLKVSEEQLASLVRKAGNSIAAVHKEASTQRLLRLPASRVAPAEPIVSVEEPEISEKRAAV